MRTAGDTGGLLGRSMPAACHNRAGPDEGGTGVQAAPPGASTPCWRISADAARVRFVALNDLRKGNEPQYASGIFSGRDELHSISDCLS
jgi:hypothetical protein